MDRAWEYQAAASRMDEAATSLRRSIGEAEHVQRNLQGTVESVERARYLLEEQVQILQNDVRQQQTILTLDKVEEILYRENAVIASEDVPALMAVLRKEITIA